MSNTLSSNEILSSIEKFITPLCDEDFSYLSNIIEKANLLKEKIKSCEIIIPLVGEFSSGKSSLLNAMLKKQIFPVDITPTTFVVNEVRFSSEKDFIEIEYENGETKIIEQLIDLNLENYATAKMVKVFSTIQYLPKNICIVDMPGLSSDIAKHEEVLKEYVPKSDAIFLVSDINQGTLTQTTLKFLDFTKVINKKIFLILTKSDTKAVEEIEEIKSYFRKNFDLFDDVITTSARKNKLEELNELIKKMNYIASEILIDSVSKHFKEICISTLSLLKEQLKNSQLDISEIKKKEQDTENAIKILEEDFENKLRKLQEGIEEAKDKAVVKFSKYMESQINKLVNIYFKDTENFQNELEKSVRSAIDAAAKTFVKEVKIKIGEFENEIKSISFDPQVSLTVKNIITGINEIIMAVLLNLIVPGGPIYAALARIVLYILEKIPKVTKIAGVLSQVVASLVSKIAKVIAKSRVTNELRNVVDEITTAFESELKEQSDLLFREIKNEMNREFLNSINSYKKGLEKLQTEINESELSFKKYTEKIKSRILNLEKIC